MDSFRHYIPAKPLSDYIEILWYWKQAPGSGLERVLPMASTELVIRLSENRNHVFHNGVARALSGGCVTGPQSRFFVLDKSEQDHLIGVHFKPGGAYAIFGCPATEFTDGHFSLDEIWGTQADRLRTELLEAEGVRARFAVLESRLREAHRKTKARHPAVTFALRHFRASPFGVSIQSLAGKVNLSSKRFTQVFSHEVGVTPKAFLRLERFQGVLRRLKSTPVDWTDLALECGYYDQSHFNHDFREFSGLNPTAYMEQRTSDMNHVPMRVED